MSDLRERASIQSAHGVENKSADEIIQFLASGGALPGSVVHEAHVAALQLRIAEMQHQTAKAGLTWAKVAAVSTIVATVIALTALLIAVL